MKMKFYEAVRQLKPNQLIEDEHHWMRALWYEGKEPEFAIARPEMWNDEVFIRDVQPL